MIKIKKEINTFLSTIYSSVPQNYPFASGQDMNANIGCRRVKKMNLIV